MLLPLLVLVIIHLESYAFFHWISLGIKAEQLPSLLGEPDRTERTMLFCDGIFSWTGDCPQIAHTEYRFYRTGIDRWVVVGIDEHGIVAFKSIGKL